ncbi:MAG: 3-phosphoshikimate 1-carboxyvinyltransferase, partial [Anaerolineales bacterium]
MSLHPPLYTFHSIPPILHPLCASVRVPGSKSLTNRALLIAALAEGTTTLTNALESDDSARFIESLQRLGFNLQSSNSQITIHGLGGNIPVSRAELFVGNAGTAARFLTALLTLGHGEYVLDGDARMRERPIGDLLDALRQLGVEIDGTIPPLSTARGLRGGEGGRGGEVCPPVRIVARGLPGGRATVKGDVSSQFLSGLLMVAPYANGPVEIEVSGELNSKPYVDMTLAIMTDFGVAVERGGHRSFRVTPQRYRAQAEYAIESDASAASYFFAAPALCGGTVRVENISRRSKQGDAGFLDVLAQMGCLIAESEDWVAVTGPVGEGS